jgi:pyruvate formate lyase activating enzyme
MFKAALFQQKIDQETVQCLLCPHQCLLKNNQAGICKVRKNIHGQLVSLNYEKIAAMHVDPIEKKPLYHFLPGSKSFSIAAVGCNLQCRFCQNHTLSVVENSSHIYGEPVSPGQIIDKALECHARSVSYTYSEPTVFFEFMLETAILAKQAGLKNIMVSNGYINAEPIDKIAPYLDAANIDLKAYSDSFYRKVCGGQLQPVLKTISHLKEKNIWVEVTTLIIPDLNTNVTDIASLISFLVKLDLNIPWHVSRFYPHYQLSQLPPTSEDIIFKIIDTALDMGLKYVYSGNIADDQYAHTYCPQCRQKIIERSGYQTKLQHFQLGICQKCQTPISGIWS